MIAAIAVSSAPELRNCLRNDAAPLLIRRMDPQVRDQVAARHRGDHQEPRRKVIAVGERAERIRAARVRLQDAQHQRGRDGLLHHRGERRGRADHRERAAELPRAAAGAQTAPRAIQKLRMPSTTVPSAYAVAAGSSESGRPAGSGAPSDEKRRARRTSSACGESTASTAPGRGISCVSDAEHDQASDASSRRQDAGKRSVRRGAARTAAGPPTGAGDRASNAGRPRRGGRKPRRER